MRTIMMIMMIIIRYASEFLQNVSIGRHRQCGDQSSQSNVIIEEFKDGREVIIVIVTLLFMPDISLDFCDTIVLNPITITIIIIIIIITITIITIIIIIIIITITIITITIITIIIILIKGD